MQFCLCTLVSLLKIFYATKKSTTIIVNVVKMVTRQQNCKRFVVSRIQFTEQQFKDNFLKKKQLCVIFKKDEHYRIGFPIRCNFQMKPFLIVGLVEAVPHLAPPRTPATPMDSFIWGYVKDTVYSTPVPDISTLMTQIQEAILTITAEIFANTQAEIIVSKFSEPPITHTSKCTDHVHILHKSLFIIITY